MPMKLLTQELIKKFPPLYGTEKIPLGEKKVIAKFFHPFSKWTFYAVEYDPKDRLFWGLTEGDFKEWGYQSLDEIEKTKIKGLPIERDLHFGNPKFKDIPHLKPFIARAEGTPRTGRPETDKKTEKQAPDMDTMLKESARWKGAAFKADALYPEEDKSARLKHSDMTTKSALDSYLMKKFGVDQVTAREVSNTLEYQNIPPDMSASVSSFKGEKWADTALSYKSKSITPKKPGMEELLGQKSTEKPKSKVRYHLLPDGVIWAKEVGGHENVLAEWKPGNRPDSKTGKDEGTVLGKKYDTKEQWDKAVRDALDLDSSEFVAESWHGGGMSHKGDLIEFQKEKKTADSKATSKPKYKLGEQSAADVKVGGYYVFTPPKDAGGYLDRKVWYGKKKLREFNDAMVDGQVIKINPKSITIQNVTQGDWNYGHIYKIPKDALATADLYEEMKKQVSSFKPVIEPTPAPQAQVIEQSKPVPAKLPSAAQYLKNKGKVHLLGVGDVPGVPASDLKVGDEVMWNFGSTSKVLAIKEISPKFISVTFQNNDDYGPKTSDRKLLKSRLVAVEKTQGEKLPQKSQDKILEQYAKDVKEWVKSNYKIPAPQFPEGVSGDAAVAIRLEATKEAKAEMKVTEKPTKTKKRPVVKVSTPKAPEDKGVRVTLSAVKTAQAKRTNIATATDKALQAANILPPSKYGKWMKNPGRFDIKGVDTPHRIVPPHKAKQGVGFTRRSDK